MKVHLALLFASALLPVACGDAKKTIDEASAAFASMTADDQAANDIYLSDSIDSASDSSSSSSSSSSSDAPEIKDDMKAERLKQMVEQMFKNLDADNSATLTLEEYLVGVDKRAAETSMPADKVAQVKTKLTEEFNKAAGEDKLLSKEEASTLLKGAAPRVCEHRKGKFPGGQDGRVKQTAAELIKQFDKDADGKLNEAELAALQAAKKSSMDDFRGRGRGSDDSQDGSDDSSGRRGRGSDDSTKSEHGPEHESGKGRSRSSSGSDSSSSSSSSSSTSTKS